MKPLSVGIVGLGAAGVSAYYAFQEHPSFVVTCAVDVDPQARSEFESATGMAVSSSLQEVCDGPVEAVFIATPTSLHATQCITALVAGKHVMVEKPLAATEEEGLAVVDAASRSQGVLTVAHKHSVTAASRCIRYMVAGESLGPIVAMTSTHLTDWMLRPRTPEDLDEAAGGGVVLRQGIHHVDQLRFLGGGLASHTTAIGFGESGRISPDGFTARIRYRDSGLHAVATYWGRSRFAQSELTFDVDARGNDTSPGHGQRPAQEAATPSENVAASSQGKRQLARRRHRVATATQTPSYEPAFGLTVVTCRDGDLRQSRAGVRVYRAGVVVDIDLAGLPGGVRFLLDDFARSIRTGAQATLDGAWGLASLELALAVRRGMRTHEEQGLVRQVRLQEIAEPELESRIYQALSR